MIYLIYKTKNLINGKIYIGYHSTKDKNDDYLGSGKILKESIKKYGKENFKKTILFEFNNKKDALLKEKEIVDENFVNRDDTYNLKVGGEGGWDYINNTLINNIEHINKKSKKISISIKKLHDDGKLNGWNINYDQQKYGNGMKGKKHSKEAIQKISDNNAMKLTNSIINERLYQYNNIDKEWGYISKLAKSWNVSHSQVRRFINKFCK